MNMNSFRDEFIKISVSREAALHQKTRQGRRPMHVHTLLKKTASWLDILKGTPKPELTAMQRAGRFLTSARTPFVAGTALGAGGLYAGKKALDKYRIGDQYLTAQEQARGR